MEDAEHFYKNKQYKAELIDAIVQSLFNVLVYSNDGLYFLIYYDSENLFLMQGESGCSRL